MYVLRRWQLNRTSTYIYIYVYTHRYAHIHTYTRERLGKREKKLSEGYRKKNDVGQTFTQRASLIILITGTTIMIHGKRRPCENGKEPTSSIKSRNILTSHETVNLSRRSQLQGDYYHFPKRDTAMYTLTL